MNTLIVFAHPGGDSFNGEMLRCAERTLLNCGHEVQVSDLYSSGFNAVASAEEFMQRRFPDRLQYDREQKLATQLSGYCPEISAEIEKLKWCDLLILQFPLWWFSVPAILKGWIDRVFVNGHAYGQGRRLDTGGLKCKRGMLSFSTGYYPEMTESDGILGSLDMILWPLQFGTLAYTGMDVLQPNVAWSAAFVDDCTRQDYLEQ